MRKNVYKSGELGKPALSLTNFNLLNLPFKSVEEYQSCASVNIIKSTVGGKVESIRLKSSLRSSASLWKPQPIA